MNISILVSTYNRSNKIIATLESLINQNFQYEFEIIVCDNNSTDNTYKVINDFIINNSFNNISVFKEYKQGLHYARNSLAKKAKYDVLYFTDDDMLANEDLLKQVVNTFKIDDRIACVTGQVLPIYEIIPPNWIVRHGQNHLLSLLKMEELLIITKNLGKVYGCHQAVLKDVFFKAEGSNPDLIKDIIIGDGETGLNIKIKELGYYFAYNEKIITNHIIPKERLTLRYFTKRIKNNAGSHIYTRYKKLKALKLNFKFLIINLLFYHTLKSTYNICKVLFFSVLKMDKYYLYFLNGHLQYLKSGYLYLIKIITDKTFKKFVEKNDWLTNDNI